MSILGSLKKLCATWVWRLMPNCAEMSRLASQSLEHPLSLRQRLKMRFHHLICSWCRHYARQLRFLHEAAPHLDEHTETHASRGLSAEARQRIVQRLQDAGNE